MSTDNARLARRRQALLDRLHETESAVAQGREAARPVELDQSAVGRISRGDALQSQAMSLAAQRRREQDLSRIRLALARIDDGSYGLCAVCGEEIAEGRLDYDPAAAACIACADG
ncbi:MAG: TraR/DksA family transcriptional regulator [Candidatus Binatia bacterium]